MHIKTLTIQGFKSYRDQTAVAEFSPGHNVVIGRNGSGKSNFFSAIRFVLSDQYTSLSREERQALLHDSSSSSTNTLSAFVEIVFDNTDGRFRAGGSDGPEMVLRRTIGLKKDEYSIDRRSCSRADVMNLLESAGFSKANPYYIVPQGRVTALTNMTDQQRLGLLKDVAGTKVYEDRRAQSIKIMGETEEKRGKIDELLEYIQERLDELDTEQKELKEYHERDKERRCLEYAIYYRQHQDVIALQEELEEKWGKETEVSTHKQRAFNEREKTLKKLEEDLKDAKLAQSTQTAEKESLIRERRELARTRANLESMVRDDEERNERTEATKAELQTRLDDLTERINAAEAELMTLRPDWAERTTELDSARSELERTRANVAVLFAKQGRSTQFSSQAERDAALRVEIASLEHFEAAQQTRKSEAQAEMTSLRSRIEEIESQITQRETRMEQRKKILDDSASQLQSLQKRQEDFNEEKKDLWKEETKLVASSEFAKGQLTKAQRALSSMMDKATANGLQAVERIAAQLGLQDRVHGPLYRLFSVEDKYKVAVEVTANQSLFHVVVDSDETATSLLEVMNREKSGRITFMPLNRLHPKELNFNEASDAIPILKRLTFDDQYRPAMLQVFAKTIVCPRLDIAAAYVRSHGVNAITLDGDRVERRGALTGGYHDPKRSRLDAIRDAERWRTASQKDELRLREVRNQTVQFEQEVSSILGQMQTLQTRRLQASKLRDTLHDEIVDLRQQHSDVQHRIRLLEGVVVELDRELATAATKRSAFTDELDTDMTQGLSAQEVTQLQTLNAQADVQQRRVAELSGEVAELTQRRNTLEVDLDENLKRDREAVLTHLEVADGLVESLATAEVSSAINTESRRRELDRIQQSDSDRKRALRDLESSLEELQKQIKGLEEQLQATVDEQFEDAKDIERQEKGVQRYLAKRHGLAKRKEDVNRNIRDLGVLPEEAFRKYLETGVDRLEKRLHRCKTGLKKYSNVNKKAVEQYQSFTRQRDSLLERKAELEKSGESIEELIEVLDQQKDEAIERTFKQVSREFESVFEKLVPDGRGRLIMQRRIDTESQEEEEEDEDAMDVDEEERTATTRRPTIESYTGISIKVSFNSKSDEGQRISQLSGGQKSLVALATIFAIQRSDPAPFYLFDEIDAALDGQFRKAIADMISQLSEGAQFITTTFRPELVNVASKCYGVLFSAQKVSTLRQISKEDAQEFVQTSDRPSPA